MKQVYEKVHFELDVTEEGFPPISVESLNCELVDGGFYKIDNTPFFAVGVALGDVISCNPRPTMKGYWFEAVESESGNKALSIIFIEPQCEEQVYQKLKSLGCFCEYGEFGNLTMLAVAVYSSIDYEGVAHYLDEMEGKEQLSYAELCI